MEQNKLLNKAYCGDGLLRYCLGKIFLNDKKSNRQLVGNLGSNLILSKIVKKNPEIFGMPALNGTTEKNYLGTVYEAHLFEMYEKEGMKKCIEFIIKTYEIEKGGAYEILGKWSSFEI